MLGDFYQILKDVLTASKEGKINRLSADQLQLTISEVDRKSAIEIDFIKRELDHAVAKTKVDHHRRGVAIDTLLPNAIRALNDEASRKQQDIIAESNYVKQMLALEIEKLIGGELAARKI